MSISVYASHSSSVKGLESMGQEFHFEKAKLNLQTPISSCLSLKNTEPILTLPLAMQMCLLQWTEKEKQCSAGSQVLKMMSNPSLQAQLDEGPKDNLIYQTEMCLECHCRD